MKLPIRTLGLATAALILGSALAPVSAQSQQSGVDGQVALRSDGALYLISNGQRRWISTVSATDEEINALPEGDPILVGLAPAGSAPAAQTTTAPPKPAAGAAPANPAPAGAAAAATTPTKTPAPSDNDVSDLSPEIPVTVDLDGDMKIKRGDSRTVIVKTRKDATCELKIRAPGIDEVSEDSKNANSQGECKYTIEIPDSASEGDGKIVAIVREGGKMNRGELGIRVAK